MPEQLTRHPEVTLLVLRSAGARCGEGAAQEILKTCPAARFCKLPGGEICVYGLGEATRMTQVSPAELQAAARGAPPSEPAAPAASGVALPVAAILAFVAGALVSWFILRHRARSRSR
ncbi:MAG: hypothetical protein K0S46_1211 [Moraxellaceae bacterium]|jgi:hypothetical protein|nr:hypothetical protein [Moraxellaceae bacterium]